MGTQLGMRQVGAGTSAHGWGTHLHHLVHPIGSGHHVRRHVWCNWGPRVGHLGYHHRMRLLLRSALGKRGRVC